MPPIPIFLIIFVSLVIVLQVLIRKRSNGFDNSLENLQKREFEANTTVRRTIDQNLFVQPDISRLPFKDYNNTPENQNIIKAQNLVLKKSSLKMIRFDAPITNTDLKLLYGLNNLELITIYEEHYNSYIKALVDWGKLLVEKKDYLNAETVLTEAINFKSDLSLNYILLTDVYIELNKENELIKLKNYVEQSNIKLKNKISDYINLKTKLN